MSIYQIIRAHIEQDRWCPVRVAAVAIASAAAVLGIAWAVVTYA